MPRPSSTPPGGGTREIRQLTGLRGLAALDVVLTHYGINQMPGFRLVAFGNSAVDLFFCLSSFTLCLVYGAGTGARLDLARYGVARVARIYPLFIVTTLATLCYSLAWSVDAFPTTPASELLVQFVRQATLLAEVPLPFLGPMGCWNNPAWSVSVEAFCYLLIFPPLFRLSGRASRLTTGATVLLAVVLGAACFVAYVKFFSPNVNGPFYPQQMPTLSLWVPLIRGVTMFGAGWMAYLLYLSHARAASFMGDIADTLALGFLAIVAAEPYGLLASAALVMVAPFLVLSLMDARSLTARILASPPIHYLGVISYSLYLWHLPARMLAVRLWPWQSNFHLLHGMVWPLGLALVISIASFHAMEQPARTAIKALTASGRRHAGQADAPSLPAADTRA